jgi:acetyltransferase-like isoleucine patch superfamily enzyme
MNRLSSKNLYDSILGSLKHKINQWNNFYRSNKDFIKSKRLSLKGKVPICIQKTILTGDGGLEVGSKCIFGFKLVGFYHGGCIELQPRYKNSLIKIGNNIATNNNIFICAANYIEIGDNTLIGQNVTIMDHEAHGTDPYKRRDIGEIGNVQIGCNVWIGNNVVILKNSEIGDNSIVATGAVVNGKFPANSIIGGIPAKIIKEL